MCGLCMVLVIELLPTHAFLILLLSTTAIALGVLGRPQRTTASPENKFHNHIVNKVVREVHGGFK